MVGEKEKDPFDALAVEEPERQVALEEVGDQGDGRKSLAQKMEEAPEPTDLQTAVKNLFPSDLGGKIYNALMIARIAPDAFMPLLRLIVVEECMKSDADQSISVVSILAKIYTLLSIGLDGKGRIDQIEMTGASKETDELEKLGKGLFGT